MDHTLVRIGKAYSTLRFNNRTQTIRVCFRVRISRRAKAPKYIGYRYPLEFVSSGSRSSKEIILKNKWSKQASGKVRVYRYKRGQRYCLSLRVAHGKMTYRWVDGRHVNHRLSKQATYLRFKKNLRSERALKVAHKSLIKKRGKSGATVGSEFFTGNSGAKGGCGTNAVAWNKMRKRPVPPKATANDFQ